MAPTKVVLLAITVPTAIDVDVVTAAKALFDGYAPVAGVAVSRDTYDFILTAGRIGLEGMEEEVDSPFWRGVDPDDATRALDTLSEVLRSDRDHLARR